MRITAKMNWNGEKKYISEGKSEVMQYMDKQYYLKKVDLCKKVIDSERPFEGNMLKQIQDFYRISTTWSSNALEGNTLTISETKVLLEDGITIGGKPIKDVIEASGHAKAFDYMFSLVHKKEITIDNIKNIHALFYSGIDKDKAGIYRTEPVIVSGSNYPVAKAANIESKMIQMQEQMEELRGKLHPIEYAAQLHKNLVFIHPFIDGNGRTARLAMNTVLIQEGYLPCVIAPVVRNDYISTLEQAHKNGELFTDFVAEQEVETMKDFIRSMNLEMPKFPKFEQLNRTFER